MTADPRTLITQDDLRRMLTGPTSGGHAKELAAAVFAQEAVYSTGREQETCAERIGSYMTSRAETIAQLFAVVDGKASQDEDGNELHEYDAFDRIHELPLSIEIIRSVKILLGTGGPADWLMAELDSDGDISSLTYHFADWFDHASVPVDRESPLWRFAESFVELQAVES